MNVLLANIAGVGNLRQSFKIKKSAGEAIFALMGREALNRWGVVFHRNDVSAKTRKYLYFSVSTTLVTYFHKEFAEARKKYRTSRKIMLNLGD